jgi:hypothetical protein
MATVRPIDTAMDTAMAGLKTADITNHDNQGFTEFLVFTPTKRSYRPPAGLK